MRKLVAMDAIAIIVEPLLSNLKCKLPLKIGAVSTTITALAERRLRCYLII